MKNCRKVASMVRWEKISDCFYFTKPWSTWVWHLKQFGVIFFTLVIRLLGCAFQILLASKACFKFSQGLVCILIILNASEYTHFPFWYPLQLWVCKFFFFRHQEKIQAYLFFLPVYMSMCTHRSVCEHACMCRCSLWTSFIFCQSKTSGMQVLVHSEKYEPN